jgi:hypothetical protein
MLKHYFLHDEVCHEWNPVGIHLDPVLGKRQGAAFTSTDVSGGILATSHRGLKS